MPESLWQSLRQTWRFYRPCVGNWTLYADIPLPFSRRVLILDVGRHPNVGWRYRR